MLHSRLVNFAFVVAAGLAVCLSDLGSPAAAPLPKQAWGQTGIDNAPDPSILFGVLPNGMMYAVQRNATPPGQTALRFMIKAGSMQEAKDQQGLAHFLEHMAFRGSTHVPDGEVKNILERLGLRFGADTNAYTARQQTVYMFNLATSDESSIDRGLMLIREIASELKIDPTLMQTEKGVVLSEERLRDTPAQRASNVKDLFFYGTHPYARPPIGLRSIVETASAPRTRDFYKSYYRPERAVLVVVGDIDPKAIEGKIKARFSDWKGRGTAGHDPGPISVSRRAPDARVVAAEGLTSELLIVWPRQYKLVPDTRAEDRRRIVEILAFMVTTQRLHQLQAAAGKPFAGVLVGPNKIDYVTDGAVLHLSGITNWQSSINLAVKAVRQVLQYGVTQDEIDIAVRDLRAKLQSVVASSSTRTTINLADTLISSAFTQNVLTSPQQDLEVFEQVVKDLKAAQINAELRKGFSGTGPLLFFGLPNMPQGNEAAVRAAFVSALIAPVAPFAATAVKSWPYTDFGAPGAVAERRAENPDVVMVRFANGARLTVKPTNFTKDQILISIRFGHGQLDQPLDRVDASRIAPELFIAGGLKDLSIPELQRTLLGKNVGLGTGRLDDSFGLTGTTTPADFDLQMQLLAAMLTAPGWRDDNFANTIQILSQGLNASIVQPLGVDTLKGIELRHSGDPRWRALMPGDVANWKFADARAFFDPILANSPLEVIVVGDVTVDRAIDAVGKTIGALPSRNQFPEPSDARKMKFPAAVPNPIELHHKGRVDQGLAVLAWPTEGLDLAKPKNRFVGKVLLAILDDRVLQRLRMEQGATYGVSGDAVFSNTFTDYGYFVMKVEIPPAKMATFFTEAEALAADIAANGVTADQLLRARTPLVDLAKQELQTNVFWLNCLPTAQTDPAVMPYCRALIANYESVTAAEIQAAAKKWLRSDTAWRLIITPEPAPTSNAR